jgi:mevalonate kinase
LDILGAGSPLPLCFAQGQWQTITLDWQPHFRLTPSHEEGKTAAAIQQVDTLWQQSPQQAQAIDDHMHQAVTAAAQALENQNLDLLAHSIRMAHDCFQAWGLITANMAQKINALYEQGAIAVKPTGSGGGGFLLSLWTSPTTVEEDAGFSVILPNDNRSHRA